MISREPSPFEAEPEFLEGVAVVHARGSLDAHTAPALDRKLGDVRAQGYLQVVLDVGGVSYVSSAGFGVLLSALHSFREAGADIRVAALGPITGRAFQMLGLDRVMASHPTVNEAVAACRSSQSARR